MVGGVGQGARLRAMMGAVALALALRGAGCWLGRGSIGARHNAFMRVA